MGAISKKHQKHNILLLCLKIRSYSDWDLLQILTQEKSVAVVDSNNNTIGSIKPAKIINTVFGGRKNNN